MGVTPFYKRFAHDGVRGPNMAAVYSDRGFGVRGPVVFYNRSNEAAARLKPGDFDWNGDLRQRRPLVPQRRHLRVAVGDDRGSDHRSDDRRRRRTAPSSRSISTTARSCGAPRAAPSARSPCSAASSSTSTCWSATKRTCRRDSASPDPKVAAKSKLDPSAFVDMMERVVVALPEHEDRRDDAARGALDEPSRRGARSRGSAARPTSRRPASSTSSIASAAATASRRASSTAC